MERLPQKPTIEEAMDTYLDFHHHSPESTEYAVSILLKYDTLVSLAAERAVDAFFVPDNVYQMFPRGWTTRYDNTPA